MDANTESSSIIPVGVFSSLQFHNREEAISPMVESLPDFEIDLEDCDPQNELIQLQQIIQRLVNLNPLDKRIALDQIEKLISMNLPADLEPLPEEVQIRLRILQRIFNINEEDLEEPIN